MAKHKTARKEVSVLLDRQYLKNITNWKIINERLVLVNFKNQESDRSSES